MDCFPLFGASGVRSLKLKCRPLPPDQFNQWPPSHWLNPWFWRTATNLHRNNQNRTMLKTLPPPTARNAPWTPFQRRTWLANERRKHRLLPAPVLRAAYPDLLQWDWDLPNPYK